MHLDHGEIVAGIALMAIGATTVAFGANEIVAGGTGTIYIQNLTGMNDGLYNGLYIGLNKASSVGSIAGNVGMKYASNRILNNIIKDPSSVQDYRLWQMKVYGKYNSQFSVGTLKKGDHSGQGYTLINKINPSNGYIQWHPGSRFHFERLPYCKVTSGLYGSWRGLYLF